MFRRSKSAFLDRMGIWPEFDSQPARDAAGNGTGAHPFTVYMVVIGDYDAYEVLAVLGDHDAARATARFYNETYVRTGRTDLCACIAHSARVEEILFQPASSDWSDFI